MYALGGRGKKLAKWGVTQNIADMFEFSDEVYLRFPSDKHARIEWLEILNTLKYDRNLKKLHKEKPKEWEKLYRMVYQWQPIKVDK